ncbi:hypothetical protein NMG60_11016534 [Bertholletia excelsa]
MALCSNPNWATDEETNAFSFSDFPEDVQLCILSFLTPSEVGNFACASKRFFSLCRNDGKLWFSLCDRRWGSKTQIKRWGNGKVTYQHLYKALEEYENLIGFWRQSGQRLTPTPPLVFFEWGLSFITGSRVFPSTTGTYDVVKAPFLWLFITPNGTLVSFLDPDCRFDFSEDLVKSGELGLLENDLVPVNVSFVGKSHVVVEENLSFAYSNSPDKVMAKRVMSSGNLKGEEYGSVEDVMGSETGSAGSLPDRLMSDIYQYFANRTSPGGDRASRRQRRREKQRLGRRKWEPEHFVKIVNCSPTPSRPFQGLWKGICHDKNLEFYLVAYDDIGGIACRRVGDSSRAFCGYSPIFWTLNTTFIESPFSTEEEHLYNSRIHLRPASDWIENDCIENEALSRILYINSSNDLVIPDLAGASANSQRVEGRIWQYENGTFGFGFLRNNYIIDLKHIAHNGCILDTVETCSEQW